MSNDPAFMGGKSCNVLSKSRGRWRRKENVFFTVGIRAFVDTLLRVLECNEKDGEWWSRDTNNC